MLLFMYHKISEHRSKFAENNFRMSLLFLTDQLHCMHCCCEGGNLVTGQGVRGPRVGLINAEMKKKEMGGRLRQWSVVRNPRITKVQSYLA